jgi:protein TonB
MGVKHIQIGRTDIRLSGALSLALHGMLVAALGIALTRSRVGATLPPPLSLRIVDLDLSAALVEKAGNPVQTPAPPDPPPVPDPLPPRAVAAPQPVAPEPPPPVPTVAPAPLAPPIAPALAPTPTPSPPPPKPVPPVPEKPAAAQTAPPRNPMRSVSTGPAAVPGNPSSTGRADAAQSPAGANAERNDGIEGPVSFRWPIRPLYPIDARRRGEEGRVVLETDVAADGHPTDVRVAESSRFAELDRAARRAVERAQFKPALENGRPIAARARITIVFRLTH